MAGRYVPPHLRNKQAPAPSQSTPSRSSPRPGYSTGSPAHGSHQNSPAHSNAAFSPQSSPISPRTNGGAGISRRDGPLGLQQRGGGGGVPRRGVALCVFGDSFGGPFKLLSNNSVKVQTFKGASAKGLNNPNSLKQVSSELVPLLNTFLAPPPYAYMPATGRSALLMFGNVDLQVNYLWQLQHKPLGLGTWSEHERELFNLKEDGTAHVEVEDKNEDESDHTQIIAFATENSDKGPALGPELFVDNIVKAYSAWLDREIVHGPIGRRAAEVERQGAAHASAATGDQRLAPTRVFVAAALPPLIEDDTLPRIPEKYVERMEEDHVRAHRAMERGEKERSRTPWAKPSLDTSVDEIEKGLAAATLNVNGANPGASGASTPRPGAPGKQSVESLLEHEPPLCTKPVRVVMTQRFNDAMRAFCARHPRVLTFVDIWDVMLGIDEAERAKEAADTGAPPAAAPTIPREVDRATWACPVDPSNIHPLWEPTLPLWLTVLSNQGVPTESFAMSADAEATFKAYEEDKRQRTQRQEFRIKLRDE